MAKSNQTKKNGKTTTKNKSSQDSLGGVKDLSTSLLGASKKKTLTDLFEDGLKDILSAEQQLVEALPKMVEAAENEELKDAFTDHLEQTKKHVQRLEKIMKYLKIEKGGKTCEAMKGLVEEADEVIKSFPESAVRDSALIIGAQKVEHYEIASYGSLCELADVLGYDKIHDTLGRTLDEEEDTDLLLSDIAKDVNDEAYEEEGFDPDENKSNANSIKSSASRKNK